jgi:hypothetical protein
MIRVGVSRFLWARLSRVATLPRRGRIGLPRAVRVIPAIDWYLITFHRKWEREL